MKDETIRRDEAALPTLRNALRDSEQYSEDDEREYYRAVIQPIEEVGISCERCASLIDAVDILDAMRAEGPQAGPEQVLCAARWTCEHCSKNGGRNG